MAASLGIQPTTSAKTAPEATSAGAATFHFWSSIWQQVREYRADLLVAAVASFLVGIAEAAQPLLIKFIIDDGIARPNADADTRLRYTLYFVSIYAVLAVARISIWFVGYRRLIAALERFIFHVRSRLFRHVQGLCFRFHDQVSSGELFNYIMGSPIVSLKTFLQQFALLIPYQLVSWVLALGMLSYFDLALTVVLLVVVVAIVAINERSRRVVRDLTANFMHEESTASRYVADMLRGCREIKIHAIEDRVSDSFESRIDRIRQSSQALTIRQQLEGIKPEALHYLGMVIIYAAGAYRCIHGALTVGELVAFINAVGLLMRPMISFFQLNLVKANAEAGLERIMRILATVPSVESPRRPGIPVIEDSEQEAERLGHPFVEFQDVTFAYGDAPVLRNVSCSIPRGRSVALVGPSGSGKSTFIRLVLRLYDPQSGQIRLNGRDLREYDLHDLRSSFGVVSQDTFLFQASIADNIRVARPEASEQEVHDAIEKACLSDFVRELPDGIHALVGENGQSLSGGQKQRVAIARAILSRPRYYLFDEATSALDNQSERRIQQAMTQLRQDHAMIVIAHRLSTVRKVDRIFVFDHGQIVQQGSFDELSNQQGLFKRLLEEGLA